MGKESRDQADLGLNLCTATHLLYELELFLTFAEFVFSSVPF